MMKNQSGTGSDFAFFHIYLYICPPTKETQDMGLELFAAAAKGAYIERDALTAALDETIQQLLTEKRAYPKDLQSTLSLRNIALALPDFVRYGADISSAAQRLVAETGDQQIKYFVLTLPLREHGL
jgi:hypothetical protein